MKILIEKLSANPWNRKAENLKDLKESLVAKGQLQQLVVRPLMGDRYEVLAGCRRLAALQELKAPAAECKVIECNDEQAREISIVENLHRTDLTPFQLATACAELKRLNPKLSYADLGVRIGKSARWVYQAIRVATQLTKPWKELVNDESVPFEILQVVAACPPDLQNSLLDEYGFEFKTAADLRKVLGSKEAVFPSPWDPTDAKLTDAGSCLACHGRSGRCPSLFDEKTEASPDEIQPGEHCLIPHCWRTKLDAFRKQKLGVELEKLKADGHTVYVAGWGAGEIRQSDYTPTKDGAKGSVPVLVDNSHIVWAQVKKLPKAAKVKTATVKTPAALTAARKQRLHFRRSVVVVNAMLKSLEAHTNRRPPPPAMDVGAWLLLVARWGTNFGSDDGTRAIPVITETQNAIRKIWDSLLSMASQRFQFRTGEDAAKILARADWKEVVQLTKFDEKAAWVLAEKEEPLPKNMQTGPKKG